MAPYGAAISLCGVFPVAIRSAAMDLTRCRMRPVMPVQALYMREMLRAVEAAVYGRKTPAQALADARKNTQAELDLVYAG